MNSAGGLKDERDKVDVRISVKIGFLSSLGHVSWSGAGCCNEGRGCWRKETQWQHRSTWQNPLRLKTRSRCPFTTRVRGTSCSMNTLVPLCECMTSAGHLATAACWRSRPPTNIGAAVGPLVCHRFGQLRFVGTRLNYVCSIRSRGVCGSINLLAMATRKKRSSAWYASCDGEVIV